MTGEPRNHDDPEDQTPEQVGIVISNFEKREDKVRRLVQELTEAVKPGYSTSYDRGSTEL